MKKGKYSLIISSNNEDVLEQFRSYCIEDLDQHCLILDEKDECFYPTIQWDRKNKIKDLIINCDFEDKYENY